MHAMNLIATGMGKTIIVALMGLNILKTDNEIKDICVITSKSDWAKH